MYLRYIAKWVAAAMAVRLLGIAAHRGGDAVTEYALACTFAAQVAMIAGMAVAGLRPEPSPKWADFCAPIDVAARIRGRLNRVRPRAEARPRRLHYVPIRASLCQASSLWRLSGRWPRGARRGDD